jgi:hypothetical protein
MCDNFLKLQVIRARWREHATCNPIMYVWNLFEIGCGGGVFFGWNIEEAQFF